MTRRDSTHLTALLLLLLLLLALLLHGVAWCVLGFVGCCTFGVCSIVKIGRRLSGFQRPVRLGRVNSAAANLRVFEAHGVYSTQCYSTQLCGTTAGTGAADGV